MTQSPTSNSLIQSVSSAAVPLDIASPLARLYWLTHESAFNSDAHFLDGVEHALQQGLGWLQYRKKNHSEANLELLIALQQLCATYHCHFIINDHVALAARLNCGLHLGKDDCPIAIARQQLPNDTLIGASCYQDLPRAIELQPLCDYVAFGAFYKSTTKPNAELASFAFLTQARQQLSCPIAVIGGITPHNVLPLLQAGADIIAVSAVLHEASQFRNTLELFAAQMNAIK